MNRYMRLSALALAMIAVLGCNARTDKTEDGGVLLSISDFSTLPLGISASASFAQGGVSLPEITVTSIVKRANASTSSLMRVEIDSYEVTYSRDDTGTRVPPRLKNFIFGTVDPNGSFTLLDGPILRIDQLNNQPLKDMIELGLDPETNSTVIRMKVGLQFFGRTISGDIVQTQVAYFTLEIVP
jgi:hypothetical protein